MLLTVGRLFLLALVMAVAGQSSRPNEFAIGPITVIVPPPEGFANAWHVPAIRDRFPSTAALEVVAVHLPADTLKSFNPDQDLTFYTRVAIASAAKTEELPADLLQRFAEQFAKGQVPDQQERLAALAAQTGVTVTQPLILGVFDQTPQSFSGLMLNGINSGTRSANVLTATSVLRLKGRMLNVYAYRRFTATADRTILEDFSKAWVRRIIAANPAP